MRDAEYDDAHVGAVAGLVTATRSLAGWPRATTLESSSLEGGGMLRFLGTKVRAGITVIVSVMVDVTITGLCFS